MIEQQHRHDIVLTEAFESRWSSLTYVGEARGESLAGS